MTSLHSGFAAEAALADDMVIVTTTITPANNPSLPDTRSDAIPLSSLTGSRHDRRSAIEGSIKSTWGAILADSLVDEAVRAVETGLSTNNVSFGN